MKEPIDILQSLNDNQKQAVINFNGPSLVLAGAGAGKTRVLTHRIAYMIQQGVQPERIMALTFTNKAADEMKERVANMVSTKQARKLWMGTFHSIFCRILRNEAEKLNYSSNFTIYDTDDSKNLIKNITKELELNTENYKPKDVLARISRAKNNLITPQVYKNRKELIDFDVKRQVDKLWQIYEIYQSHLMKSNVMDFDDLLLNTNILFRDFRDVLEKYQDMFDYFLVDEYQDTNYSQYLIIKKLSNKNKNLCVVGDDSQSIYSFRGARIENILNFKTDYPEHKLFKLEQNYRSTQNIVNAANSLIKHNRERIPKIIYSLNEEGDKIEIFKGITQNDEANLVAQIIEELHVKQNISFNKIAVLYRINARSRVFEEVFRKMNIPHKIYGSFSFYQRKEIKDVIAYIRLAVNNDDDEALLRIINVPHRGIGPNTIDKIQVYAVQNQISIWKVISNKDLLAEILKKSTVQKITQFLNLIQTLSDTVRTTSAFEFIEKLIIYSRIVEELKSENSQEAHVRIENINELVNSIKDFEDRTEKSIGFKPNIIDYLEHVSLLTSIDQQDDKDNKHEKVTLMTVHSSKGLEFDVVFIVGAEKTLFPLNNDFTFENNIEEERRLFYVALTRAKKKVYISFAEQRKIWGDTKYYTSYSPFISEIDDQYLKISFNPNASQYKTYTERNYISNQNIKSSISLPQSHKKLVPLDKITNNNNQSTKSDRNLFPEITEGVIVMHNRFGKGKVLKVEGTDINTKALVDFETSGQKQLLLKYAKLTVI